MTNNTHVDNFKAINLQFFAEGVPVPVSTEPVAPAPTPTATPAPAPVATPDNGTSNSADNSTDGKPQGSLQDFFKELQNSSTGADTPEGLPATDPTTEPVVPTEPTQPITPGLSPDLLGIIPDKFKAADGTVNFEELVKSYTGLEQKLGEQGNQLGQMKTLQEQLDQIQQKISQPAQTQQPNQENQELSPEQVQGMNEQFLEQFYANPFETMTNFLQTWKQQAIMPELQPMIETTQQSQAQQTWQNELENFASQKQDFKDVQERMPEILADPYHAGILTALPDNSQKLQYLYNQAKTQNDLKAASQKTTLEDILKDPTAIEKLMGNDTLKQNFLQSQAEAIKSKQPPQIITNNQGGVPLAAPDIPITNTMEASRASKTFFEKFMGQ